MRRMILAVLAVLAGASAAPAQADDRARVWTTTGTGSTCSTRSRSRRRPRAPRRSPSTRPQRYQRIEGLGASITDSSAHLLARSPYRDAIMRDLFAATGNAQLPAPADGRLGLRRRARTTPTTTAGPDFEMKRFSIAHDEREILPLLRQARRLNPDLKVMGTPWSPPAWMKTNDSLVGGRFIDDAALLRRLRALLRQVRRRRTGAPASRSTR